MVAIICLLAAIQVLATAMKTAPVTYTIHDFKNMPKTVQLSPLISELFITPKRNTEPISSHVQLPPPFTSWQPLNHFLYEFPYFR